MAFSSGNVAIVSVNGTDVSAFFEKATMTAKRTDLKLPRLGSNGVARLVGPREVEFKCSFWIDPTVTAVLFPLINTDPPATFSVVYEPEGGGDTRTCTCYMMDYEEDSDAKEANKGTCTMVSSDGVIA